MIGSVQSQPKAGLPCWLMNMLLYQLETVSVIEATSDVVGFENVQLQRGVVRPGMVHQGAAHSLPLVVGMDEDSPDIVADQGKEPDYPTVDFVDGRLGTWKPLLRYLSSLIHKELFRHEGVRNE